MATVTNKPFFFLSGKVEVKDGNLQWRQGLSKKKIALSDIIGFYPEKSAFLKLHLNPRFHITYSNGIIVTTERIKISKSQIGNLLQLLKESGARMYSEEVKYSYGNGEDFNNKWRNCESFTCPLKGRAMWFYEKDAGVAGEKYSRHLGDYKNISFADFDGKRLYSGYADSQFEIKGMDQKEVDNYTEFLIKAGAKIGAAGRVITHRTGIFDFLRRKRWGVAEKITITDDAIVYNYRKGKKSSTTYLPVADIYCELSKGNTIKIYGKQNILPVRGFDRDVVKETKTMFKDHVKGKYTDELVSYWKLFGMFRLFKKRSRGAIATGEEGVLIMPHEADLKRKKDLAKTLRLDFDDIDGIYYKKQFFFSQRANMIVAYGSSNYRKDQNTKDGYEVLGFKKIQKPGKFESLVKSKNDNLVSKREMKKLFKEYKSTWKF